MLYRLVQANLASFMATMANQERPLPRYVIEEFEGFLRCGILANGFARVHCCGCGYDRLVAFSCKLRGICGSCIGRRMASTAAHLVDNVLPAVPMRQWVLTVPHPLRAALSYDTALCALVVSEHVRSVFGWLRNKAKQEFGLAKVTAAYPGSMTAVQRFNSACALSVHIHTLVTDGVFVVNADGTTTFRATPAPSNALDCAHRLDHLSSGGGVLA